MHLQIQPAYSGTVQYRLTDLSGKQIENGQWHWQGQAYHAQGLGT
ncbi:MAG: hypothetical protein U5L96_05095 [Owenweeksia sp.]|nr:hypothetical protein [Owenweeksia sp.]